MPDTFPVGLHASRKRLRFFHDLLKRSKVPAHCPLTQTHEGRTREGRVYARAGEKQ